MKEIVKTDKAPAAIGPYSQAVRVGKFLFTSGQIPIDPATGELVAGSAEEQAERALENLKNLIEASGYTMRDVVKTTVFAASMEYFAAVNGVYARYFADNPPGRSFVAVKELPRGALVEIEAVAWKSKK